MAKKQKYYVVWQGHEPGIYDSWTECQRQIKAYPDAKYKAFATKAEAEAAFLGNFSDYMGKNPSRPKPKAPGNEARQDIIWDSIAVDAACSGNPGAMEYQGVYTATGDQIFHQKFPLGTNNIGEFLAIVHALAMFHQQGKDTPIYTDSRIAQGWVRQKKCRTKLKRDARTERLYQVIARAEKWLQTHSYPNKILKWNTEKWGEIPADFGRK